MPRTVSGTIDSALPGPTTSPGYLVYMGFPGTPIRHSTLATVTFGGYEWLGNMGTKVQSVSELAATVELRNSDLSASALVLGNSLADLPCEIYQLYNGDATLVFSGFLDGSDIGGRVTLTAKAMSTARKIPNKYITYPVFNYLIPPGTELNWNMGKVVAEDGKKWRRTRR